jgi:hypothetical protein
MTIIFFLATLTEETLTICPIEPNQDTIDALRFGWSWTAKLQTIGPPTIAYGEDATDALEQLIKKVYPKR